MTRHRQLVLWLLWGCVLPSCCAMAATGETASTAVPAAGVPEKIYDFDIPAQPLEAALIRYGVVSGHPALFPSDIVTGRTSSALRGTYAAEVALRQLLNGTGLTVDRLESDLGVAFVLKPVGATGAAGAPSAAGVPSGMAALFNDQTYPALVQTRIWQALCTDARTAPGGYRSLFRFQVDAEGRVNGARLLRSSGEPRRDAAIVDILQHVRIDRSPPPALVQHRLAMLLLPAGAQDGAPCDEKGQGR